MALPASGCKHTSSSGATNPVGARPARAPGAWPLRPIRRLRRLKDGAPPWKAACASHDDLIVRRGRRASRQTMFGVPSLALGCAFACVAGRLSLLWSSVTARALSVWRGRSLVCERRSPPLCARRCVSRLRGRWLARHVPPHIPPWSDVRLPAELKHITKRRRRKQP